MVSLFLTADVAIVNRLKVHQRVRWNPLEPFKLREDVSPLNSKGFFHRNSWRVPDVAGVITTEGREVTCVTCDGSVAFVKHLETLITGPDWLQCSSVAPSGGGATETGREDSGTVALHQISRLLLPQVQ